MADLPVGPVAWLRIRGDVSFGMERIDNGEDRQWRGSRRQHNTTRQLAMHGGRDRWMAPVDVIFIRDHGHAHGSRRSELTNYLGENPGGNLGTAQANPCCWLTPIGP